MNVSIRDYHNALYLAEEAFRNHRMDDAIRHHAEAVEVLRELKAIKEEEEKAQSEAPYSWNVHVA